jgi:hypothetical protein
MSSGLPDEVVTCLQNARFVSAPKTFVSSRLILLSLRSLSVERLINECPAPRSFERFISLSPTQPSLVICLCLTNTCFAYHPTSL